MSDWERLEAVDPWGQRRDDYRAASIAAAVLNAAGGKSDKTAFTPEDYLLSFEEKEEAAQSPEEIERIILQWAKSHNAIWAHEQAKKAKKKKPPRRPRARSVPPDTPRS